MKTYCCVNCVASEYLKSIISSNTSIKGNCYHCKKEDADLTKTENLQPIFVSFFDSLNYEGGDNSLHIDEFIVKYFPNKIFNPIINIKSILENVFHGEEDSNQYLDKKYSFNHQKVDQAEQLSTQLLLSWEDFTKELININRFHLKNELNLEELQKIVHYNHRTITTGKEFFRGRIGDDSGFDERNMRNPPPEKARPGRANPNGISYLYVADSLETVVNEIRASYYDLICIGTFKVIENLNIVNLDNVESFDPMQIADDPNFNLDEFMSSLPFTNKLQEELSKPIRRRDNKLDYIPTQYLCEFIKTIEIKYGSDIIKFDGVRYKSSSYADGYNLAIFNPEKLELVDRNIYEVEKIDLSFNHRKNL